MAEDGFLGERRKLRRHPARVWCVDPLDGTANFAASYPRWAVAIALLIRGEAVLAVTFDPLRGDLRRPGRCRSDFPGAFEYTCGRPNRGMPLVADSQPATITAGSPAPEMEFRRSRGRRESGSMALDFAWLAAGRV